MAGSNRELIYATMFGTDPDNPEVATGLGLLSLVPGPELQNGAGWNAGAALTFSKPFAFASRRKRGMGAIGTVQYPALFMIEIGEQYTRQMMLGPAKVVFITHVEIVTNQLDPNAVTAKQINDLADAVEDVVESKLQLGTGNLEGLSLVSRINGREVVDVATGGNRYSIQIIEVETIVSH